MAHDLRTPLARMRGRLERAYAGPRDGEDDQALIGDTLADLDSVLRMFASLMRISQIEASDRMAGFGTVNLAHIAREVVELFDSAAEEKRTRLSTVADEPVLVTGDRNLLFDAVANLIDNALKFTRRIPETRIQIDLLPQARDKHIVVVFVRDNGCGFDMSRAKYLFGPFQRLHSSRKYEGTGIGLATVKRIIQKHGGRILAESEPDKGATFYFTLTCSTASAFSI